MKNEIQFYKARFIIIWDEGQHKTLQNGFLGVRGNEVEGFYTELPEGTSYEDLGNVAITPGFINLHAHPSELYGLKSYREDIGNPSFYESTLYDYSLVLPMGDYGAELQTKINLAELLKSGCTTSLIFGGPYSKLEAETAGGMGMRAYVGAGIRAGDPKEEKSIWYSPDSHSLEYAFDEESGMKRIEEAGQFVADYDNTYGGRINVLLGPTQSMTCTPKMLKETRKLADELKVGITIHGSESMMEFEACVRTLGKTPVELMAETGMIGPDVIVAHCLYVKGHSLVSMYGDGDLRILGDSHTTVAHCPWVLARAGNTLQSFAKYKKYGINMGIGTDSFPSDFVQEMRYAAVMGKVTERSTFATNAGDVFNAATLGGAQALRRKDLGKLEKGAKADFVVFTLDNIEMAPVRDVVKNIVYSATRHSIERVYVDGKCLVKDGQIEGFDEGALCLELQKVAEKAWKNTKQYDREGRMVDELSPLACPRYSK